MTPRADYQFNLRFDKNEIIVDSFAGGGGASKGIEMALGRSPDIAINHDREAIALHSANHPETQHLAEDVWQVDPVAACQGRPIGLMWLSPDCKHFSKAKGGKPASKKIRGLAWVAVRWAKAVRPRVIVLENVEEFQGWGPVLRATNQPDPARKGHTFRRFIKRLESLGYRVEWKELRASNYDTPTIRKRLFLIARCDGRPIAWPTPSNGPGHLPVRTAAEIIDWSIGCPSIFTRKKPLAENTLKRIARGIQRYVIDSPRPFIVTYYGAHGEGHRVASLVEPLRTQPTENRFGLVAPVLVNSANGQTTGRGFNAWPMEEPLRTMTAAPGFCVVAPVLAGVGGRAGQSPERPLDRPYQTITAKADGALIAPILVHTAHGEQDKSGKRRGKGEKSVEGPLASILATGNEAVIAGFLKPRYGERPESWRCSGCGHAYDRGDLPVCGCSKCGSEEDPVLTAGQAPRVRSLEEPMPVIVPAANGGDLVAAFMAQHNTGNDGHAMQEPLSTIAQKGCTQSPVAATLISLRGTDDNQLGGRSIEEPLPTISGGGIHAAEVRAFLVSYYGSGQPSGNLNAAAPTVTAKDRFGLVTVDGTDYVIADIGMRMLAPRELYRAQGFPDSYRIEIPYKNPKTGKVKPLSKTAQVRMCGNSVCPPLAKAIVAANCPELARLERVA